MKGRDAKWNEIKLLIHGAFFSSPYKSTNLPNLLLGSSSINFREGRKKEFKATKMKIRIKKFKDSALFADDIFLSLFPPCPSLHYLFAQLIILSARFFPFPPSMSPLSSHQPQLGPAQQRSHTREREREKKQYYYKGKEKKGGKAERLLSPFYHYYFCADASS